MHQVVVPFFPGRKMAQQMQFLLLEKGTFLRLGEARHQSMLLLLFLQASWLVASLSHKGYYPFSPPVHEDSELWRPGVPKKT